MRLSFVLAGLAAMTAALPAAAQQSDGQALAKQLANPVADLISVPFQFNYDSGFGTTDADRWLLNSRFPRTGT